MADVSGLYQSKIEESKSSDRYASNNENVLQDYLNNND